MKTVGLEPIHESQAIHTGGRLLDVLLARRLKVLMACRGKGICATCHVYVKQGAQSLSPKSPREERTLSMISGLSAESRLACQCLVQGEGVVVELPPGMFIERADDLLDLLGTRAPQDILHPVSGAVLIAMGKIITRSRLEELSRLDAELKQLNTSTSS